MNSAKRVSNQSLKSDKKNESIKIEGLGKSKKIIFGGVAIALLIMVIAVCWENLHPRVVFSVNGEKVYLQDVMPDIYMAEATGAYMDQLYKENYGSSYWELEAEEGLTNAEFIADNTLEAMMQRKMLYKEATGLGYTLTDEENSKAESDAENAFGQVSDAVKKKTGLTKEGFLNYFKEMTITNRYKQDIINGFDIDTAAITAGVSKEDYRQYDVQYYYIPFTKQDDKGQSVDMTEAEKQAAISELQKSYDDIKGLDDFTSYIDTSVDGTEADSDQSSEEKKDEGPKAPANTNIKYSSANIIETDEDASFGKDLIDEVKKMDKDEISEVVEGETGCYIFKMVDNNSMERYDSECSSLISQEENKRFQDFADQLEVDKYTIDLNEDEWDKLEFGTVTIAE